MSFADRAEIFVKGGDGGDGCATFRREKYIPFGGPNGGDGGRGGNVILRAVPGTDSLAQLSFKRHWKAQRGENGMGKGMTGRSGHDLIIAVPPGTIIRDREANFVIKDLVEPNSEIVIARGGKGGKGNTHFATSTNQAPKEFEHGFPGEERWIVLELKMIADIGLIGLPNAGKSTLLSRLTRAHPLIADYPFTTKYPNLGICFLNEDRTCVIADIPGLIEGAHAGVGLGHEFLRHVERTRALVHLVECQPMDGSDPLVNYQTVRRELELYSTPLANTLELIAISKSELGDTKELEERLKKETGRKVLTIYAVTGQGLRELTIEILRTLDEIAQKPAEPEIERFEGNPFGNAKI